MYAINRKTQKNTIYQEQLGDGAKEEPKKKGKKGT